jgi:predicted unusual protein kinase regulating ubiquinone biosynthesis (AarF/ABC1/UbiB family)
MYILFQEFLFFLYYRHSVETTFRNIAHKLASLNVLYVKIFQALACNAYVPFVNTLDFTDNVPFSKENIDYTMLTNVCDDFNLEQVCRPFKAGMISLVFFTHIKGDPTQKRVIKLKRKNIDNQLKSSIKHWNQVVHILNYLPYIRHLNIIYSIQECLVSLEEQLHFDNEIRNMEISRNNCKRMKYVCVPTVYDCVKRPEYKDNVIVMEFIDGRTISELNPDEYVSYSKSIIKYGIVSTVLHGFTHADLHAGNILFLPDYKIALLDFGLVHNVSPEFRDIIGSVLLHVKDENMEEIINVITYGKLIEPIELLLKPDVQTCFYNAIVQVFKERSATQDIMYSLLNKLCIIVDKLGDKHIHLNPELVKIQLVLAMSHGITMTLCKDKYVDVVAEVSKTLMPSILS